MAPVFTGIFRVGDHPAGMAVAQFSTFPVPGPDTVTVRVSSPDTVCRLTVSARNSKTVVPSCLTCHSVSRARTGVDSGVLFPVQNTGESSGTATLPAPGSFASGAAPSDVKPGICASSWP